MSTVQVGSNENDLAYFVPRQVMFRIDAPKASMQKLNDTIFRTQATFAAFVEPDMSRREALFDINEEQGLSPSRLLRPNEDGIRAGFDSVVARLNLRSTEQLSGYIAEKKQEITANQGRLKIMDDDVSIYLLDVFPNWLVGGGQKTIGTGGPSSPPLQPLTNDTEAATRFTVTVAGTSLNTNGASGSSHPVDVFILDTLPKRDPNTNWVDLSSIQPQNEFELHPLGKLLKQGPANSDLQLTWFDELPATSGLLTTLLSDHGEPFEIKDADYDMSDHGLFIAGIVKQIAPHAHIHVIQVLNERGVGSIESISAGFAKVADLIHANANPVPVIVNCSFTVAVPQAGHSSTIWDDFWAAVAAFWDYLASTSELIGDMLAFGQDDTKCVVVAAAGNDSNGSGTLPARFPAYTDLAIGVGALEANGTRAPYSNAPDQPTSEGVATIGTIRSIFTQALPNPADPLNPKTNGFAVWSGTSFSTAVITGVIANLCGDQQRTPKHARDMLYGEVSLPGGGHRVNVTQP